MQSGECGKDNWFYKLHMKYGPIYKLKMLGKLITAWGNFAKHETNEVHEGRS